MLFYWLGLAVTGSIGFVLDVLPYFEPVTALPYGIDSVLFSFIAIVHALLLEFPFFVIVWNLILLGILVEVLLFSFEMVMLVIRTIRG